jgi:quercetin dioxygenase-like cupin family protein
MSEPTAPGELEARLREASRLADLVAYQEGGVVSRALLARESGTVTLFAFDADQRLSEHTAPYDALVLVLEGEADVTVSGRRFHLRAGETLLVPAREPHAVQAPARFKMLLVMLRS